MKKPPEFRVAFIVSSGFWLLDSLSAVAGRTALAKADGFLDLLMCGQILLGLLHVIEGSEFPV